MRKKPLYLSVALLAIMSVAFFAACHRNPHFISDRTYRHQVEADYEARVAEIDMLKSLLVFDTLNRAECEAMKFLYAYMPYSDMADYTPAFFLDQVRYAFAAREQMPWGKEVPEDIFRHFVLVYRVNNENLDTARQYMFHQLRERVQNLSMYEAALEVNHWCHEHVAYRAADARTSAPLATLRTSLGRCGEESTFAVTALRSVGIPARQCYTPRWAHCDDNHAWVEVWIADSNQWMFLGACEPDPQLNMGWFSIPSTRCLMVHSKAFGRYHGDEEVVRQTALYSELNLLSHYAPTRRVTITVTDSQGSPMKDATVKFKMYNYAEYFTLATYPTNANGQASLTTGLGDILVWATDGTHYAYRKLDVRKDSTLTLVLPDLLSAADSVANLDIVPPAAGAPKVVATDKEAAANAKRIAYEDSLRNAYTATFPTKENYRDYLPKGWCWNTEEFSDDQVWEIVQKSEGNYAEIFEFFSKWPGACRGGEHIYDYLRSYSDKDLRDITADVLLSHRTSFDWSDRQKGTGSDHVYTYEVYKRGILPARVSNELVRPYREELADFRGMTADAVRQWVLDSITVDDTGNYYNCPISPVGVYRLRHADPHSRDIFFVAACRAADIPAYLDNATNILYTWQEGGWTPLSFSESGQDDSTPTMTASVTLVYNGKEPAVPVYYPHFTLQKLENGDFRTFDFEGDSRMTSFPATLQVAPGIYCLSTGNRYSDGTVLSRMEFFTVKAGESETVEIVLRPLVSRNDDKTLLPKLPEDFELMDGVGLTDYAGKAGCILAFLGPHREPAKHLVKEMLQLKAEFEHWGGMTFCTTTAPDNADLRQLSNIDIVALPSGVKDPMETVVTDILKQDKYEYPLVAVVDKEGHVLFHSTGYKIGLAEMLLKYCR